jgi:Ni,Fe-hydrogenase III large subunit/Ni,Fe-hydrogenase III component G
MNFSKLISELERWPGGTSARADEANSTLELQCAAALLPEVCGKLFLESNFGFAGLVVEEEADAWTIRYVFCHEREAGFVHVLMRAPRSEWKLPSIVKYVHAADWHEREAEDLFGIFFEGHPRLGDFVLHNDVWQEGVKPMRHAFDPVEAMHERKPDANWRPPRVVHESGAFVMPIGPKYSGVSESAHFLLETVGEDVVRSIPRLFYKWRAVEKLAEGKTVDEVLLLAERFAATTAFAHGLAFCQAVESLSSTTVPTRARLLRVFVAELERLRQHAGAITDICESTALVVAASQGGIFEEDLLRISGELAGHRYFFGLLSPGGLMRDLPDNACRHALARAKEVTEELNALERQLRVSSSFLDRLEEVGFISTDNAKTFGLVGPLARASDYACDLRKTQPYGGYEAFEFDVPREREGDGYARLRLLFAEARQSVRIMEQAVAALLSGEICAPPHLKAEAALGWVEAPRGAAFHWVRLNAEGRIARYHIVPPSFSNWLGFHVAVEKFAFQDFPIVLATLDLSMAESDR